MSWDFPAQAVQTYTMVLERLLFDGYSSQSKKERAKDKEDPNLEADMAAEKCWDIR